MGNKMKCNHVFIVRGFELECEKCGQTGTMHDYSDDRVKFLECESGRCGVI